MSSLYVYLMRSRNKDNKDIPNFKQRVKTILEYRITCGNSLIALNKGE